MRKSFPSSVAKGYGPWRCAAGVSTFGFLDGRGWIGCYDGSLYRFDPEMLLRNARERGAVQTTAQWASEYRKRLTSDWLNAVRMHLTDKNYDKALAAIAEAHRKIASAVPVAGAPAPRVMPADDVTLWEALVLARKGNLAAADGLYLKLADDPKAEDLVRGLALLSLINVRHAAGDWPALAAALDKLTALFPGLNDEGSFALKDYLAWFRQRAEQGKAAVPPTPASAEKRE